MISPEQRALFGKVVYKKAFDEPVYYLDEWLRNIAIGQINASSTDEVKSARNDERSRYNNLLQKASGKRDTAEALLKAKAEERKSMEQLLREKVDGIAEHGGMTGFHAVPAPYSEAQKKAISEFAEITRRMLAADRELISAAEAFEEASKDVENLRRRLAPLVRIPKRTCRLWPRSSIPCGRCSRCAWAGRATISPWLPRSTSI
jgi:hypothetical protein